MSMSACHMRYGVSHCVCTMWIVPVFAAEAKRKETQEFFGEEQAAKKLMEGNGFQLLRCTIHRMIKATKESNEEKTVSVYWWPVENPLLLFAFVWSLQERYKYVYMYLSVFWCC